MIALQMTLPKMFWLLDLDRLTRMLNSNILFRGIRIDHQYSI